MGTEDSYVAGFVTTSSPEEGRKIADALVEERLAACVNVVDNIHSTYRWQGKVEKADESLLVIKTRKDLAESVIARVRQLHSYSVPEIIFLPIIGGSPDYLTWIRESTE
jgi:periplasmic divalent cation tolerance protein